MVGIVLVSHSYELANAISELAKVMGKDAKIACAGGLEDNSFGASYQKIKTAIQSVYSNDGVIILMDMGSSVMTTEMVLEELQLENIKMVDAPIVEGAIAAAVGSSNNFSIDQILAEIKMAKETKKF